MPTKAEKEAEEARQKALKEGRFAAAESDDNAVAVSDEGYVGVSPEYMNHAYDTEAPLRSEDEDQAALEKQAKDNEVQKEKDAANVGFRGYAPETPHPSEAVQPVDATIEQNRAIVAGQAAAAAQATSEGSGDGSDGDGGDGSSPLGG